jgi:predicted permease
LRRISLRLRTLLQRERVERELEEEFQFHIEQRTELEVARGLSPDEARSAALRAMDGLERRKDECRDVRRVNFIDNLSRDLRYAGRSLRRSPGFTATAVLTLALGIGANTAIFSIVNVFLFRPLPVKDADRMTVIAVQTGASGDPGQVSYLDYLDYREHSDAFTDITGFTLDLAGLGADGHADRLVVSYVPSNFFSMLGLHAAAGRLIEPGEGDQPRTGQVIVLGYNYWQKRFGGDPSVIGRTVSVDGQAVAVIGVVQKEFTGAYSIIDMDAYLPIGMNGAATNSTKLFTSRSERQMHVLATLKPGITESQAQAGLAVIADRLAAEYPRDDRGQIVRVFPERLARPEPAAAAALPFIATVFLGLVGLVLLVACINVANLLLARAAGREREMAIRAALGAGRARLISQLLTESLLLAIAGGVGGALIGTWACRALEGLRLIGDFPVRFGFAFDLRVFGYVAGISTLSGIIAGLAPALRISRTDLNETLREGGRGLIGAAGRLRLRSALVIAQVAGSLVVLVAAGLFVRSLTNAQSLDLGFDARNVLNVGMDPGLQGYDQPRAESLLREVLRRVRATPGVEAASLAFTYPASYYSDGAPVFAEGQPAEPSGAAPFADINRISPGYFSVMRLPVIEGRPFSDADTASSQAVAIVNQTMAGRLWPGQDPVGRRFSYKDPSGPWVTVVGVARDAKNRTVIEPVGMYFYVPQSQNYSSTSVLQVRTSGPPESLTKVIESEIRELDPNLPLFDVMSMERALGGGNGFFLMRAAAAFAGIMGGLGLLLAVVGVYGVVSYNASQRRHEIGIRMALGAKPRTVFGLVLGQAAILVGAGAGLGLLAAVGATRFLGSLLIGVAAYDPLTFVSVASLLIVVALVACYLPARRAARVDPATALRYE